MKYLLAILLTYPVLFSYAQKQISGQSSSQQITLKPNFERGLPPNLYAELEYNDANGNGILEANESSELILTITNKGKGNAQGLKILVKDDQHDEALTIEDSREISLLYPGQSTSVRIPIYSDLRLKTAEHKLEINVSEHFGYDMDPAYLVLNTYEFQKAELVFSGIEIIDSGEGTGAINADKLLQAGEQVQAKILIQNIGQNIAYETKYKVFTEDPNIYLENAEGSLGDLKIGEVIEFFVTISPNKRIKAEDELPIYLNVTEKYSKGNLLSQKLPIILNQAPPESEILQVSADIESLKSKVARFEYQSSKFNANLDELIDIRQVSNSKTKRPQSVGVVFGVEQYQNLVSAPYAKNDAFLVEQYFKERLGIDQVVMYTNEEVAGFIFDDVFNPDYGELQKTIKKGETELFVFYSGHGLPSKEGDQIFLFPADGKIERLERQGYNLNTFYTNLEKLGAKSVTVFLDACFSGTSKASENIKLENLVSMKGIRIRSAYEKPWERNDNFSVFTSSTADQTSLAFDATESGLFTYYFCAGLQGKADINGDRQISYEEMSNYIKERVEDTSKKIRGLQSPEFFGNKDKILLRY